MVLLAGKKKQLSLKFSTQSTEVAAAVPTGDMTQAAPRRNRPTARCAGRLSRHSPKLYQSPPGGDRG